MRLWAQPSNTCLFLRQGNATVKLVLEKREREAPLLIKEFEDNGKPLTEELIWLAHTALEAVVSSHFLNDLVNKVTFLAATPFLCSEYLSPPSP